MKNPLFLFLLFCFPMLGFGQVDLKTYVPDDNFENYLEANSMGDGIALNDSVNTLSVEMLMSLDVSNENISDLTGIEDFTVLSSLKCYSNQLTSLDVSNNIYLTALRCQSNQLTSLDVSQNTALNSLFCFSNFLTSLDVSQNTALTYLYSHSNQLTSLDVSQNIALYFLKCESNQLTSLDISTNNALQYLHCYSNQLISLDVSNDTALIELHCQDNQLTGLDLSSNSALYRLICNDNQLTSLDLRNGNNNNIPTTDVYIKLTNNPDLYCIEVDNSAYSTTNWTVSQGIIDTQSYFSVDCSAMNFYCTDSLEVTDVIIDNSNLTMNIAIYNGYNSYLSMPYVAFTIDANGDTIQQGNMNLFVAWNLDTTWYDYSINSAISPSYPLTMYFVYVVDVGGSVTDTCALTYNSTPTDINYINESGDRKLISIIDLLGRETKGTKNEPLFYIYDDGTVEKKIILE